MATVPAPRSPSIPRIVLSLSLASVLGLLGWLFVNVKKSQSLDVIQAKRYLERGQPERALQLLSHIRDDQPGAAEALTLAARALLSRGDISSARRFLERSLSLKLDQADAAKMLAAIYIAGGDGQRGIAMLKKAAQLDPIDFRPWYAMGKLYHDMGNLAESIEVYTQALNRSPPPAEARESRIGRVRALLDANRAQDATDDLNVLRQQTPKDPQVLALSARQARDLGRADEAEHLADLALADDPNDFDALLVRARLRVLSHRPELAIADLKRAIKARPNDLATMQTLAQVQRGLGRADEAAATQKLADRARDRIALMDQLSKMIDQSPNDPEPRYRMGQSAMEAEWYVLAYQCFQAALDLDPGYKPARKALDTLRSKDGFDYDAVVKSQLHVPGKSSPPRP